MKYFTPQRLIRLQDTANEEAMEAAIQDWEGAAEEYAAHLKKIGPKFPGNLRRFIDSGSLHDARLLVMWPEPRNTLRILLQREHDKNYFVDLRYSLIECPRIDKDALPELCRSTRLLWLYDEIDLEAQTTFRPSGRVQVQSASEGNEAGGAKTGAPIFTHDILLSNGWEIHLCFTRLTVKRPAVLLPPSPEATTGVVQVVPRSA